MRRGEVNDAIVLRWMVLFYIFQSTRRGWRGVQLRLWIFFFNPEARDGVLSRPRCCGQRQRFVWARMGLHVCAIAHEALRLISPDPRWGRRRAWQINAKKRAAAFGARRAELDRRAFGRSANPFVFQPRLAPQLAWTVGCRFNFRHLPKQSASARRKPAHVHGCTARSLRGTASSALCPSLAQVRPCDTLAQGSLSRRTQTRASAPRNVQRARLDALTMLPLFPPSAPVSDLFLYSGTNRALRLTC